MAATEYSRKLARRFRRYRNWTILPAVYVAIAWSNWALGRVEIYPFAPWAMFNDVPNSVTRFTVYVDERDGGLRPIWSLNAKGINGLPLKIYRAQTELGRAIERRNADEEQVALRVLSDYLKATCGKGQALLKKEAFDPAQLFRDGVLDVEEQLLRFEFGESTE